MKLPRRYKKKEPPKIIGGSFLKYFHKKSVTVRTF